MDYLVPFCLISLMVLVLNMCSNTVLMCYEVFPKLKTAAMYLNVQTYVRPELHSGMSYNDTDGQLSNVSSTM